MLKTKQGKRVLGILAVCAVVGVCAMVPVPEAKAEAPESEAAEGGLTINTEKSSDTLYTDALKTTGEGTYTQKYAEVKRGDFVTNATVSGTVVYPKQETIRYNFPYGVTYFLEMTGTDSKVKKAGDPIANIYVQINEIELASRERQLQRMEERGETGSTYEDLKETLTEMQEAYNQTQIVMEKDGYLLEQGNPRYGTQITSYSIVVADLGEQLIEVPNENKQFRFGQEVTVSAKIGGQTVTGTGTVITASPNSVSEELAGSTAYIRLDEESVGLYAGSSIQVTLETVHMEDVLLLDANATYAENGNQMAKIKDEYGLHAVGFSFGRKNTSTYWVIDGLEEGAQILVQ
ncbi:MAG: hypothetical protein IJW37_01835 [Lachnospiraceae bacterium]|nr:hypothetical protein [Lachnospiraceae bacterium]